MRHLKNLDSYKFIDHDIENCTTTVINIKYFWNHKLNKIEQFNSPSCDRFFTSFSTPQHTADDKSLAQMNRFVNILKYIFFGDVQLSMRDK